MVRDQHRHLLQHARQLQGDAERFGSKGDFGGVGSDNGDGRGGAEGGWRGECRDGWRGGGMWGVAAGNGNRDHFPL